MIVPAKQLRDKSNLNAIVPGDKPGYYKWWAEEKDLDVLLHNLKADASIRNCMERNKEGRYCIYVGIAAKESIRNRLDWHVNDTHTPNRVKNGTLSTLRQSISSVIAKNQFDKQATDEFIDKLIIEFFTIEAKVKSPEAVKELGDKEKDLLKSHLYPLNIRDNKHPARESIIRELKRLRRSSKQQQEQAQ